MIEELIMSNRKKVQYCFDDYSFGFNRYLSFLSILAKSDSVIADMIQDTKGVVNVSYALAYIYNDVLEYTGVNSYNSVSDIALDNKVFESEEDLLELAGEIMSTLKLLFTDSDNSNIQLAMKFFQPIPPISEDNFIICYYHIQAKIPPYGEYESYNYALTLPYDLYYNNETALMRIIEYIDTYK